MEALIDNLQDWEQSRLDDNGIKFACMLVNPKGQELIAEVRVDLWTFGEGMIMILTSQDKERTRQLLDWMDGFEAKVKANMDFFAGGGSNDQKAELLGFENRGQRGSFVCNSSFSDYSSFITLKRKTSNAFKYGGLSRENMLKSVGDIAETFVRENEGWQIVPLQMEK